MNSLSRRSFLFSTLAAAILRPQSLFAQLSGRVSLIGGSLPLSGDHASIGQSIQTLLTSQLTSIPGLELQFLDDGGDISRAEANYLTLAQNSCSAFVGVLGPERLRSARSPKQGRLVPSLVLDCPGEPSTASTNNQWVPSADEAGAIAAKVAESGRQSLALVYQLSGGGRALEAALKTACAAQGLQFETVGTTRDGIITSRTRDLSTELRRRGADAVVLASRGSGPAAFIRIARDFGWDAPVYCASICDEAPLTELVFGGQVSPDDITLVRSSSSLSSEQATPALAEYLRAQTESGLSVDRISFEAFLQGQLLALGIGEDRAAAIADDDSEERLTANARSFARTFDGVSGWSLDQDLNFRRTSPPRRPPLFYTAGPSSWRRDPQGAS